MEKYHYSSFKIADIGDYLKVFACTAVMSQPIMAMIMTPSSQIQFKISLDFYIIWSNTLPQLLSLAFSIQLFESMT